MMRTFSPHNGAVALSAAAVAVLAVIAMTAPYFPSEARHTEPVEPEAVEREPVQPDWAAIQEAHAEWARELQAAFEERNAHALRHTERALEAEFDALRANAPAFAKELTTLSARLGFLGRDIMDTAEPWVVFWREQEGPDRRTEYVRTVFAETVVSREQLALRIETLMAEYLHQLDANAEWLLDELEMVTSFEVPPAMFHDRLPAYVAGVEQTAGLNGADFAFRMRRYAIVQGVTLTPIMWTTRIIYGIVVGASIDHWLETSDRAAWEEVGREFVDRLEGGIVEGVGSNQGVADFLAHSRTHVEASAAKRMEAWKEACGEAIGKRRALYASVRE